MNQTTLKSIMRLFALVRQFNSTPNVDLSVREAVTVFLNDYTSTTEAHEIINIFNYHCDTLAKRESSAKLLSLLSVKSTIICSSIVGNLTKQTRIHIALIVLDILAAGRKLDLESFDLVRTIGTIFQLLTEEMKDIIAFANVYDKSLSENVLLVSAKKSDKRFTKHIFEPQLTGEIVFLYNRITHSIFFKHIGAKELLIRNGNLIKHSRTYLLGKGGIIENYKISSLFYGKLQSHFSKNNDEEKLLIEVKNISYRFPDGVMAIHPLSFNVQSSEMIGVLGNSGAGKTTLLNLLAGNFKPFSGKFLINGNDWYSLGDEKYSLLGFIPQDDLLIKELTVFQNLYFAARLSLKGKSGFETAKIVLRTLDELGLSEIKRFKVGTPERSIISGGQRKRLNLALELVRNPQILLVDEPTSGLASTDSERIIDIIKRKTQSGAIALVNIHQPSSDIFKVFDRILVLDTGGRAVFFGNPIDALVHLKTVTSQVDSIERECFACGNVNPEQILSIIEQRKLKADGMPTEQRLFQPDWWYEQYNETPIVKEDTDNMVSKLPKSNLRRASRIQQLKIYVNRNVLSMITDRQFLTISLLEAPILALLLAFLSKHFGEHNESAYTLFHNQNIPAYLLMSIIVAMFFGLMIGAERIIREKHIVSRESFLGLSRLSYINSKLVCLFLVLSIQVTLYLVIGNLILGIRDGWYNMWIVLFSIAFNAGVLALNLSSGLRSSVAIYISIPILLMPQLLLNGSLIPFDKLHRSIASQTNVPPVANMVISRWGYEALVVNQFTSSNYNKIYSQIDRQESELRYFNGYLIPEVEQLIRGFKQNGERGTEGLYNLLIDGINQLGGNPILLKNIENLSYNSTFADTLLNHLSSLKRLVARDLDNLNIRKDTITHLMASHLGGIDELTSLKLMHSNQSIRDLVLARKDPQKIVLSPKGFVRKFEPIYSPVQSSLGKAHLYSSHKRIGGLFIHTVWFNLIVIWLITIVLYISLLYDWLKKLLALITFR